jgi:three-Cys-motif partner protein
MPDETLWPLEHHTAAKHEILRRYLGAWFPILTSGGFNRRVLFLDGFAGPGIYEGGELGSPIIALDTLVNHAAFARLDRTEFVFYFVEKETPRFKSLEEQVAAFWQRQGGKPGNVIVRPINDEFANVATGMADAIEEQKKRLAPTFAFIDPFGWSGVPLDVIGRLLSYDKCEVFFNFMYDSMNRFLSHDPTAYHRRALFSTDEYQEADGMGPEYRSAFLHELYERQLRTVGGFNHVHRFEMINKQGHPVYSLFFGTRSKDGLRCMKDAMWKVDPVGGIRFSDRLAGVPVLFQPEPDYGPLRTALRRRFGGVDARIEDIEDYVLCETPYRLGGLKRDVLRPMQVADHLIDGIAQRRPGQFPNGTVIRISV